MSYRPTKTSTDKFWNKRAQDVDFAQANIDDLVQRSLENKFMLNELNCSMRVLEVGCGNGYLTRDIRECVSSVKSFDFSEEMIDAAKKNCGEANNEFFVESVLNPNAVDEKFDAVLCVRVLINLDNVEEQKQAIRNMTQWVKPGGRLILVEGYSDGFSALSELREDIRLSAVKPANINFYSEFRELRSVIEENFHISNEWNSGFYDVLTRVAYPLLVGEENVKGPSDFHDKMQPLLYHLTGKEFGKFARLNGISAVKK